MHGCITECIAYNVLFSNLGNIPHSVHFPSIVAKSSQRPTAKAKSLRTQTFVRKLPNGRGEMRDERVLTASTPPQKYRKHVHSIQAPTGLSGQKNKRASKHTSKNKLPLEAHPSMTAFAWSKTKMQHRVHIMTEQRTIPIALHSGTKTK